MLFAYALCPTQAQSWMENFYLIVNGGWACLASFPSVSDKSQFVMGSFGPDSHLMCYGQMFCLHVDLFLKSL